MFVLLADLSTDWLIILFHSVYSWSWLRQLVYEYNAHKTKTIEYTGYIIKMSECTCNMYMYIYWNSQDIMTQPAVIADEQRLVKLVTSIN